MLRNGVLHCLRSDHLLPDVSSIPSKGFPFRVGVFGYFSMSIRFLAFIESKGFHAHKNCAIRPCSSRRSLLGISGKGDETRLILNTQIEPSVMQAWGASYRNHGRRLGLFRFMFNSPGVDLNWDQMEADRGARYTPGDRTGHSSGPAWVWQGPESPVEPSRHR